MFIRNFSITNKKPLFYITNSAWNKIDDILKKTINKSMIFSAKGGGCNGFNYSLQKLTEDNKPDNINNCFYLENKNNKVYLDTLSEMFLIGTTIDYQNEDFNKNIFESKFLYLVDKNKISQCGCGVSFTPKNM